MTKPGRSDAFSFYACTIASFLEATVAVYVENLKPFFGSNEEDDPWLQEVWLPEEAEHGRLTQEYVHGMWLEFEWERSYSGVLDPLHPALRVHKAPRLASLRSTLNPIAAAQKIPGRS